MILLGLGRLRVSDSTRKSYGTLGRWGSLSIAFQSDKCAAGTRTNQAACLILSDTSYGAFYYLCFQYIALTYSYILNSFGDEDTCQPRFPFNKDGHVWRDVVHYALLIIIYIYKLAL